MGLKVPYHYEYYLMVKNNLQKIFPLVDIATHHENYF